MSLIAQSDLRAAAARSQPNQMRGRESAWWVHAKTGEVVPVQYHAKTVAENPRKFGLTHADVRKASAGVSSFDGRRVNPLDKKAGGAARDLIGTATKNDWVRVRHMNPTGVQIQSHGHGEHMHKVIDALSKRGVRFRGNVTLDMPEHKFTKTFGTAEKLATASKAGEIPSFTGRKPTFANDQAARNSLRARLYASAGLSMHERARRMAAGMKRLVKEAISPSTDGDDSINLSPANSGTRKIGLSGPDMAAAIAKKMAARRKEPKSAVPVPMDNSTPPVSSNDSSPALQMPATLR